MTDLANLAFMPLHGHPLPDGTDMLVNVVTKDQIRDGKPGLLKPTLKAYDAPCDVVTIAVPAGLGEALGAWIASQVLVVPSEGTQSPEGDTDA